MRRGKKDKSVIRREKGVEGVGSAVTTIPCIYHMTCIFIYSVV